MAHNYYPNEFSNFSGHFAYSAAGSQYSVNQVAIDLAELNNRRMSLAYSNQIYGLPNIPLQTPQGYIGIYIYLLQLLSVTL